MRSRRFKRLTCKLFARAWCIWKCTIDLLSAEWIVTEFEIPNGGSVVLIRTLFVTAFISSVLLPASNIVFPGIGITPVLPYIGASFGGVYASFYSRYSSQWTYLANIYHRIKESESRAPADERDLDRLAEWKAGLIEDVEELHLVSKPIFASVIVYWLKEPAVRAAYERTTVGCPERLQRLQARVRLACIAEERRRQRRVSRK